MSGINFKFTGTNDDVLKKIHQIQNELSKVYNKTNNTKIDLGKDIDFSLLGENFKRLDQQSRDAFNKMSKEAQQYTKDIQSNILALQQVEKMQSGLNTLYEEGNMDLDSYIQSQARLTVLHDELAKAIQENEANLRAESVAGKIAEDSIAGLHAKVLLLTTDYMNLSRVQRESLEGAALLKNLQETQTQLDNASLSMNKYAAGAKNRFDALGFSVTQIARELPALAFGPQMSRCPLVGSKRIPNANGSREKCHTCVEAAIKICIQFTNGAFCRNYFACRVWRQDYGVDQYIIPSFCRCG